MALKLAIRREPAPQGFFDALLANEMPEVWALIYVLALVGLIIFLVTG
ncbi:MAG: hypothetical protein HYV26_09960 [Candidatus Hydrogenedentes bacterium]|nr:hypothetical protein [Candidatus Hydrogenedentota bacterium]